MRNWWIHLQGSLRQLLVVLELLSPRCRSRRGELREGFLGGLSSAFGKDLCCGEFCSVLAVRVMTVRVMAVRVMAARVMAARVMAARVMAARWRHESWRASCGGASHGGHTCREAALAPPGEEVAPAAELPAPPVPERTPRSASPFSDLMIKFGFQALLARKGAKSGYFIIAFSTSITSECPVMAVRRATGLMDACPGKILKILT